MVHLLAYVVALRLVSLAMTSSEVLSGIFSHNLPVPDVGRGGNGCKGRLLVTASASTLDVRPASD